HLYFRSKPFRRESPESAKLVRSYYQARGKRCQKRIVGAGRPVREATNIAANADAQLDGKEIDPAGRKRRGPADQRKGNKSVNGRQISPQKLHSKLCVLGTYLCLRGSTWTGSEVARKGVGREDTFVDANGLILETRHEDAARDRKNRRVLPLQLSDVLIVKFETARFAVLGRQSLRWGRIFLLETLFAAHGNSADLKAPSPQAHATCWTFRIDQEAFRKVSVQPPPPTSRLPGCPL